MDDIDVSIRDIEIDLFAAMLNAKSLSVEESIEWGNKLLRYGDLVKSRHVKELEDRVSLMMLGNCKGVDILDAKCKRIAELEEALAICATVMRDAQSDLRTENVMHYQLGNAIRVAEETVC